MASEGPRSGGTFESVDDGSGRAVWGSPGNAASSDDTRSTTGFSIAGTRYHRSTNFGFAIPSGATIDGIVVEIEKSQQFGSGNAQDEDVYIVKGGSPVGDDNAAAGNWPSSDAYTTYGGASDLWGTTWSDTDINASTFGVQIRALATGFVDARIDHVRITVYYTEGGGGGAARPFLRRRTRRFQRAF